MFTHLNVSSAYSAYYGVAQPPLLAKAAKALGFEALAVTDRDGLYGAVKHIGNCIKEGLVPIVGVNIEVAEIGRVKVLATGNNRGAGWSSLCKLVSKAHQKPKRAKPGITLQQLGELSSNCVVLVGHDSAIAQELLANPAIAKELAQRVAEVLDKNQLIFEVVNHLTEPGSLYSTEHARAMCEFATGLGYKAILSNAVRYLEPDDAVTADVLDSARELEPLGIFQLQPNAQAWLKPQNQMATLAVNSPCALA